MATRWFTLDKWGIKITRNIMMKNVEKDLKKEIGNGNMHQIIVPVTCHGPCCGNLIILLVK